MLVENTFPADTRVRNEAYTLNSNGIKVSVIALRGRNQPAREDLDGISVYRVPRLTVFEKLPDDSDSIVRKIVRKLKTVAGYLIEYGYFTGACLFISLYIGVKEGFDVLHAHNPPDTLFAVGAVHRLLGRRFVFDHHDLSPELYLSRYKTSHDGLIPRILNVLEKCSVRLANVLIVTNASYREIDIARHGADPERVFIVRNGPDLSRVRLVEPDAQLRSSGRTILGYIGAMNPQDGVDYLLRALQHLRYTLQRDDFYCVIIGDGDSLAELKVLSTTLGLEQHVRFTGFIPDELMIRYLSTADIGLDPNPSSPLNDVSTWIKVMEYMALGKPIVSFDLKETRTSAAGAAVYVPPNDEAAFARAVRELMDDPARRAQMGEIGRQRIREELGWAITSRNLLRAYGRLFNREFVGAAHEMRPSSGAPLEVKAPIG
jgi:glycosyltransferase involved in cell wall biosynthesis